MSGGIPRSFIDNLLSSIDIVDVISRFVPLQKKGQDHMACCPFHEEKTPSFSVSSKKQIYYCFGCHAGGNVVKFLMDYSNVGFIDAIETLAQIANVDVPRESRDPAADREYKALLGVLSQAAGFYQKNLGRTKTATDYLVQRGVDEATVAAFGIGYAPDGFDGLRRFFGSGYNERLLLKAGLIIKKNEKSSYDRFRKRLMFPIRDRQGRTIAFGGRVLDANDQPKYLNSPETPLFRKSRTIYGLHEIREHRKLDSIIVVEGYMDVVSLSGHGVGNAVATLGTAVTREHVEQLFRLCDKLVFCFDGDSAGRKAALSALEHVLPVFNEGRTAYFMFLPEGEDPDSFVRKHKKRGVKEAVDRAMPLSAFMFERLSEGLDLSLAEARASFTSRARPLLGKLPKGTMRDLLRQQLARESGIEDSHLSPVEAQQYRPRSTTPVDYAMDYGKQNQYSMIRVAIALLLSNPSFVKLVELPCDEIRAIGLPDARLLADLIASIRKTPEITPPALFERYRDGDYEQLLMQLLRMPLPGNKEEEFRQSVIRIGKYLEKQRFVRLIEKSKTGVLDEKEQGLLQAYISNQK